MPQEILALRAMGQEGPGQRRGRPQPGHRQPVELRDAVVRKIPVVPAEELVPAVSRQYDGDVAARDLGDVPRRDGGRISERFVEVSDEIFEDGQSVGAYDEFVVVRPEMPGDGP